MPRKKLGEPSPGPRRPDRFSDSFTTEDAKFSVDVVTQRGRRVDEVAVEIDCGGKIYGDVDTLDLLIEMLEAARDNLLARRGKAAVKAYWARGAS